MVAGRTEMRVRVGEHVQEKEYAWARWVGICLLVQELRADGLGAPGGERLASAKRCLAGCFSLLGIGEHTIIEDLQCPPWEEAAESSQDPVPQDPVPQGHREVHQAPPPP